MAIAEATKNAITTEFRKAVFSEFRRQARFRVDTAELPAVWELLKSNLGFDLLVDITCVDYLNFRDAKHRFGLVYLLSNTETSERLAIRAMVDDPDPHVASAVPWWRGANWLEREVWDMFGIQFDGHPEMRRILLPEEFAAHPLRKDYPLQGRGERHNFPVIARSDA